jgi:deoxyribose-phosphate aldolase
MGSGEPGRSASVIFTALFATMVGTTVCVLAAHVLRCCARRTQSPVAGADPLDIASLEEAVQDAVQDAVQEALQEASRKAARLAACKAMLATACVGTGDHATECPVCLDAAAAVSTSCGHSLCVRCAERILDYTDVCPCCRQTILYFASHNPPRDKHDMV